MGVRAGRRDLDTTVNGVAVAFTTEGVILLPLGVTEVSVGVADIFQFNDTTAVSWIGVRPVLLNVCVVVETVVLLLELGVVVLPESRLAVGSDEDIADLPLLALVVVVIVPVASYPFKLLLVILTLVVAGFLVAVALLSDLCVGVVRAAAVLAAEVAVVVVVTDRCVMTTDVVLSGKGTVGRVVGCR